ncbi:hypothetical protein QR680_010241 [Steinernema hermaphroditum]|uniref:Uncharacterized protein n=1 Tax=Steinernema hermaphroditum TaxID=289476 RepID=A0AA39IPP5_9BILA|nr:hypothetical protein QR680_010241 [Steinernema hermaphroditum]
MSFADLSPDVIFDVVSTTFQLPTVPVPTKLPYKPDFEAFEKFHKISGPWNDALLRLKYRDINKTLFDQVKIDFHSRELLLFPQQDSKEYQHICCPLSFAEDLSRIEKLRTVTIAIDGDDSTSGGTSADLKAIARLFHEPQELRIMNLTKKHCLEGQFISLLSHDFTDIRIEDVRGQATALKKFLSRGLRCPKLRYLEIIKCDTYKSLCNDLLENVKSGATRYIILEQSSQKFDIAFFQEVIDWWQREGAGKERFLKFALRRSDGKKLLETLGDTLTSHSMRHNTCEKSFVFVTMENCQSVRLEMKVSNKTM